MCSEDLFTVGFTLSWIQRIGISKSQFLSSKALLSIGERLTQTDGQRQVDGLSQSPECSACGPHKNYVLREANPNLPTFQPGELEK